MRNPKTRPRRRDDVSEQHACSYNETWRTMFSTSQQWAASHDNPEGGSNGCSGSLDYGRNITTISSL